MEEYLTENPSLGLLLLTCLFFWGGGEQECCSKASDGGSPGDFLRAGKCLMDLKRLEEARVAFGRARWAESF